MGLNIYCEGPDGKNHPEWDNAKLAGDKEFAALFSTLPYERGAKGGPPDFEPYYRPTDFAAWRAAIASRQWPNPGRYEKLMDLLEANPEFQIYLSW